LKSWKTELPKWIAPVNDFSQKIAWCRREYSIPLGISILFLKHGEHGKWMTSICSGNITMMPDSEEISDSELNAVVKEHEETRKIFDTHFNRRLRWLELVSTCGCKNFDKKSFFGNADAVAYAKIKHVEERFSEWEIQYSWKDSLPEKLTVQIDEQCQDWWHPYTSNLKNYLLYPKRDNAGNFSTGFCSGNSPETSSSVVFQAEWMDKQTERKEPE
jgi:hypothetical protein